jgi:flagellar biosynthesis anti-sigma factor FlgM
MRIDPNQTAQALAASERSGSPSAAAKDSRSTASSLQGEDQADLSGGHIQVQAQAQALAAQVLQFPEVRQEKVDALRQVVLNGSYQPSPDQIAGAVFSHMLATPAA